MKSTNRAGPARPDPSAVPETETRSQDRAAFLEQLVDASDRAAAAVGGFEDVWLELAGRPIRLRFVGPALSASLLPALAHLRIDPVENAALTVRVWDSESTSSPAPAPTWDLDDFREYGVIRGFFGDGLFTVFEWGSRSLNVVNSESAEAFFWVRSADSLGLPERGAPLRTLFNLWLAGQDVQLVHGGAVGHPNGCVLLVGRSGAGKTSTALSCLDSDLGHIGEDYCLVSQGDPPTVASLYSSAKVEADAISRLPKAEELVASMPVKEGDKALLDIHAKRPQKMMRGAPLAAVAIPRITGQPETTVEPSSAGAALAAVAPSTMLQLPGNGAPAMRLLSSVVQSVPCLYLNVGTDPSLIPLAIDGILREQ
jgi:hypothetical protein